jgi:hypothetical protein
VLFIKSTDTETCTAFAQIYKFANLQVQIIPVIFQVYKCNLFYIFVVFTDLIIQLQ